MGVALKKIPAVLKSVSFHKPEGSAFSLKKIVLDCDMSSAEVVEALSGGTHPLFKGLDVLEQSAANGGGPYKLELCRRVGDMCVDLYDGKGKAQICCLDSAKFVGAFRIHIAADAESMRAKITVVGAVLPEKLAALDAFCGADVMVDLTTLQTDEEEEQAAKSRTTKARNKAPQKVALETEAELEAGAADDGDDPLDGEVDALPEPQSGPRVVKGREAEAHA